MNLFNDLLSFNASTTNQNNELLSLFFNTKLSNYQPIASQLKIQNNNAKYKILYRLVNVINRKCRKIYYSVFYHLQQSNKNYQQNIQIQSSKHILINQQQTINKFNIDQFKIGFIKLSQLISILSSKYYNAILIKNTFNHLVKCNKIQIAINTISHNIQKLKLLYSLKKLKNLFKLHLQIQIFVASLKQISKKMENNFSSIKIAFERIIEFNSKKKINEISTINKYRYQTEPTIPDFYKSFQDQKQFPFSQQFQVQSNKTIIKMENSILKTCVSKQEKLSIKPKQPLKWNDSQQIQLPLQVSDVQPFRTEIRDDKQLKPNQINTTVMQIPILQFTERQIDTDFKLTPTNRFNHRQRTNRSPIKSCRGISDLIKKFPQHLIELSNYESIAYTYKVNTKLRENCIWNNFIPQKNPTLCRIVQPDSLNNELSDLCDQSSIFSRTVSPRNQGNSDSFMTQFSEQPWIHRSTDTLEKSETLANLMVSPQEPRNPKKKQVYFRRQAADFKNYLVNEREQAIRNKNKNSAYHNYSVHNEPNTNYISQNKTQTQWTYKQPVVRQQRNASDDRNYILQKQQPKFHSYTETPAYLQHSQRGMQSKLKKGIGRNFLKVSSRFDNLKEKQPKSIKKPMGIKRIRNWIQQQLDKQLIGGNQQMQNIGQFNHCFINTPTIQTHYPRQ